MLYVTYINRIVWHELDSSGSGGYGRAGHSFVHGNEISGSKNAGNFFTS